MAELRARLERRAEDAPTYRPPPRQCARRDRPLGANTTTSSSTRTSDQSLAIGARDPRGGAPEARAPARPDGTSSRLLAEADGAGSSAPRPRRRRMPSATKPATSISSARSVAVDAGRGEQARRIDAERPAGSAAASFAAGRRRRRSRVRARPDRQARGVGRGTKPHDRRDDLRRRREGARRARRRGCCASRPPAGEHAEPPVGLRAGRGDDALGHLALEHQRQTRRTAAMARR